MNVEQTLRSVRAAYPDLAIVSVEPAGGQNSDVLLANGGALVFRFPRYGHVLERMRVEAAVLSGLQGRLPLPVPVPLYVHLEAPVGEAFLGYRCLRGEPLRRAALKDLPRGTVDRLGEPANFAHDPVLRHGDFGASNILFDPRAGQVTGIIDWTSAGAGDPAYDLAGLWACYGEGFVRSCARGYPAIDGLWDRIRHYAGRFALEEALFGVEYGDDEALRAGLAGFA